MSIILLFFVKSYLFFLKTIDIKKKLNTFYGQIYNNDLKMYFECMQVWGKLTIPESDH
jgi:hypothetical protein